ncbi:tyrosine-type recombinase/integrase [Euzebya sp.]|uniref:tyrosine-type recombinase/integrase n=1 Tax=Euzebya sp. TaxID=1971409 RepID=UPI0035199807
MGRPRTPIGTFGAISTRTRPSGLVEARTRYRDWDGTLRTVQASADSRTAAERALKAKLAERSAVQPQFTTLTADSSFEELVDYWLDDLDLEGRLAVSTRQSYERNMRNLVLPVFAPLALREIGVARCDAFLKHLAKRSYNRARQARVVMRLAFSLAVRHEVLPRNPMDNVAQLRRPPSTPTALTPAEVNAVRAAIRFWEEGQSASGPRPDGQLGLMVEVMLGTSARIGEVLAIRRRDVDVTSAPPTIRIAGTLVDRRNLPVIRQDHPKTARSRRVVALPSFTAEAVRRRLTAMEDRSLDALLFSSRVGTPLMPNNVRRQLRAAMDLAGIEGVTPHMLRRSVATAVHAQASVDLAAELLGHTDPKITIRHYIRRSEMVNPVTADLLDHAFGTDGQNPGAEPS